MRRGRHCFLALSLIVLGLVILMGILLPGVFWWFLLAAALLALGIWLLRCC